MITNIGSAHLEGLKDIDGVANEKTDIFKFTKEAVSYTHLTLPTKRIV